MNKRFLILITTLLLLAALLGVGYAERYVCQVGDWSDTMPAPEGENLSIPAATLDRLLSSAARKSMPSGRSPITYEIISQAPVTVDGQDALLIFLRVRDADDFVTVIGATVRARWPWHFCA